MPISPRADINSLRTVSTSSLQMPDAISSRHRRRTNVRFYSAPTLDFAGRAGRCRPDAMRQQSTESFQITGRVVMI